MGGVQSSEREPRSCHGRAALIPSKDRDHPMGGQRSYRARTAVIAWEDGTPIEQGPRSSHGRATLIPNKDRGSPRAAGDGAVRAAGSGGQSAGHSGAASETSPEPSLGAAANTLIPAGVSFESAVPAPV